MKKYKQGEISKSILQILEKLKDTAPLLYSKGEMYRRFRAELWGDRARINKSLKHLKFKKYIRTESLKNEEIIEITSWGRRKLLQYKYDDILIPVPKKWDNKWRIVIFDIPEKKKKVRDSINMKLKELGFESLQKSTFVYPHECRKEIEFIKNHFLLKKEIRYILAEEIDNEMELIRLFDL